MRIPILFFCYFFLLGVWWSWWEFSLATFTSSWHSNILKTLGVPLWSAPLNFCKIHFFLSTFYYTATFQKGFASKKVLCSHRYNYLPNRHGGISGFGQAPTAPSRRDAPNQGRHNWGRGNLLGGNWCVTMLEKLIPEWKILFLFIYMLVICFPSFVCGC